MPSEGWSERGCAVDAAGVELTNTLDTSDIERYIGVPLRRNGTIDPLHVNDIRRWAQAMHHPNPLYYDEGFAAQSRFGRIVAPQSFTVVADAGHGAYPATYGTIPESQMLFAGDEWWFNGPRIVPGDRVTVEHRIFDCRLTQTRFAGPSVIQRGDNHYTNQKGEKIAVQRSSALRYRPEMARATGAFTGQEDETELSDGVLASLTQEKRDYVSTISELGHDPRGWESVEVGDQLPTKVIGPHSVVTFATEWRAYIQNLWGSMYVEDLVPPADNNGWAEGMSISEAQAAWDPEFGDGAYFGPPRGHLSARFARQIGMPRSYGYGASIGAWIIDYLSSWCGEWGYVEHTNSQYRGPALSGDVTYARGTVTAKSYSADPTHGLVHIDYVLTNQNGSMLAKGTGDVVLPHGRS
jgi:acyl dehydratase